MNVRFYRLRRFLRPYPVAAGTKCAILATSFRDLIMFRKLRES
jgi:hypothetical protein